MNSWDKFYANIDVFQYFREYRSAYMLDVVRQIEEYYTPQAGDNFLEIGCGFGFMGAYFVSKGLNVYGVDTSRIAIEKASVFYRKLGIKGNFIVGDIQHLPYPDNFFNVIYGGGVLEHCKDTQAVVRELYRVLKPGGVVINCVPYLNLASLTYRQLWGDIPNLPVLKQIAEFIHIKLLRGKHMTFGYGLSLSAGYMKKIHRQAGFRDVIIEKWDTKLQFKIIPFVWLKRFCTWLANNNRQFWPMIKVVGIK